VKLRPNRFGIPEPVVPASEMYRAMEVDLVLLPLVAFDDQGNRLGMGGGFYDTTLAMRAACHRFRRPRVIGLAHECQRIEHIATEPWDIPLDLIATDRHIYTFGTTP
jgi:5-formyltetrahydrofolate cyclo-ligase